MRHTARRPATPRSEGRKQGRGDPSDAQWRLIEPLLPRQLRGGRWNDHRLVFDGILWILRTGAPWRDLPERYGKWGSVYHRFNRWRKDGPFDRVLKALRIRLDKDGSIDWDLWCVGWLERAGLALRRRGFEKSLEPGRERGDHALGRSRGGWGSKFHLVVDGHGIPLAAVVTAGQAHESKSFVRVMEKARPPRWPGWPLKVAGDRGTATRASARGWNVGSSSR
jgi:transposase